MLVCNAYSTVVESTSCLSANTHHVDALCLVYLDSTVVTIDSDSDSEDELSTKFFGELVDPLEHMHPSSI